MTTHIPPTRPTGADRQPASPRVVACYRAMNAADS